MSNELLGVWKGVVIHGPTGYCLGICLEELRITMKHMS
jgi:hypothetical protein